MGRNKFVEKLKENKEGMVIGAMTGFVVSMWFLPSNFNMSGIAQSYGILDIFSTGTTIEFAKTKLVIGLTVFGAALGYLVDEMLPEGWLRKWRRKF